MTTRRKARNKIKPSTVAVYASAFILLVAMVFLGYRQPQSSSSSAANAVVSNNSDSTANTPSVDNAVAAGVAANVAQTANLPIATSVANLAVSAQSQNAYSQTTDSSSALKPQLINPNATNRSVTTYLVKAGDTVTALSSQFGITAQTIKWANNLTSDALTPGTTLRILPVDGVLYNVKATDTIDSIAAKYGVDKTRLILYNDLDVSGLTPNTTIILPNATLPGNERPGYVAPTTTAYYYAGAGAGFGGSTWRISVGTPDGPYAHGNCTLYAYNRRIQLGLTVGANWGNASSWAYNARLNGLAVNNTPGVGAIIQNGGYLGHVGIVESILPNGDLSISEMNAYVPGGGYNIVSGRIIPAGNVSQYLFIH